jgi:C4-dicarboxylate transporter, DctM subunit
MEPMTLVFLIFVVAFLVFLFSGWAIAFAIGAASILAYVFVAGGSALGNFAVLSYNAMSSYDMLALPFFILMGEILIEGGVAGKLYDSVLPLMERFPGGLIHTNIVANVILGACCGSTIAATTAISSVAIPELTKRGYAKEICFGSLASAGCLACLIPPSIGMIIFASLTTVSLGKLFIAGIIPGLLLAAAFSFVVAIWVKLKPAITPPPKKEIVSLGIAFLFAIRSLWPLFFLIVLVLGVIYLGIGTPTEAGCFGVIGSILLSYKKIDRKNMLKSLLSTCQISGALLLIIAMASVYGFALNALGLRTWLLSVLSGLPGGAKTQMYLIWMILLVLGMFLDSSSVIVITTPILLPFSVNLGFEPLWFGIYLMLAVELGNITPPVGLTMFAVQAVSKSPINIVAKGCLPFWVSFFMVLSLLTMFPNLVTWLPNTGMGSSF